MPQLIMTRDIARRLEGALTSAATSRLAHVALVPGNPLGVESRQWQQLSATLVAQDVAYYRHFNAIRGLGRGYEEGFDEALRWFESSGRACTTAITPFDVDERLLDHLLARGLHPAGFISILYGDPSCPEPQATDVVVRMSHPPDLEPFLAVWLRQGGARDREFLGAIGKAEFTDWRCYVAYVERQPAAIAGLYECAGVGVMAAGHTLPEFRRRGCQAALLRARMRDAANFGCTLVVSQADPGSASQRNMERAGLHTAYTQSIWATRV